MFGQLDFCWRDFLQTQMIDLRSEIRSQIKQKTESELEQIILSSNSYSLYFNQWSKTIRRHAYSKLPNHVFEYPTINDMDYFIKYIAFTQMCCSNCASDAQLLLS